MLTTAELVLLCLFLPLFPLALYSIVTRELPPEGGLFGRFYRIQHGLFLCVNIFLVIMAVSFALRVAFHFGVLDKSLMDSAKFFIGMPIAAISLLLLGLFSAAGLKLFRQSRRGP